MLGESKLRIVVASPSDVSEEREIVELVVDELNDDDEYLRYLNLKPGCKLQVFRWETDSHPGFHPQGVQGIIDSLANIKDSHLVVVILWKRFGTPTSDAGSGTQHEFNLAFEGWRECGQPQIMAYFKRQAVPPPATESEADQLVKIAQFRSNFPREGFAWDFEDSRDFERKFRKHLRQILHKLIRETGLNIDRVTVSGSLSLPLFTLDLDVSEVSKLAVLSYQDLYSSFQPLEHGGASFLRLKIQSTPGYIPILVSQNTDQRHTANENVRRVDNYIYVIRDPIRPFEIQIGEQRSLRNKGVPEAVPIVEDLTLGVLEGMYPFISDEKHRWLRIIFAELASDPEVLNYLYYNDCDEEVKQIAAKNPSAPNKVKQESCAFCRTGFLQRRQAIAYGSATIFANDFPYGPFFHYVVLPKDPVHSWNDVCLEDLRDMNAAIWDHLNNEENLHGSAGVRIGLNSSIKHLVLGKTTRSSAGATITHVHKQVWGMAKGSVNLGGHLDKICRVYREHNPSIDYLDRYLQVLKKAGYVIWEDDHVALYIPLGQISLHELQIMVKRRGACNYLELTKDELESFSKGEFIVVKIYQELNINSFNEIMLSTPFEHSTDDNFRLINTFITREVDLAVSELNLLYVVDKHPSDTLSEIKNHQSDIEKACNLKLFQ